MNSTKINEKIRNEELAILVIGIRKKLNLSQTELGNKLNLSRFTTLRCENMQKVPRTKTVNYILSFIKNNGLDISELHMLGQENEKGYTKDRTLPKLHLNQCNDLAELLGIILGDGEILKDGTIRISFDPKKDKNFLYRRVFKIIDEILGCRIVFESYKRVCA